MNDKEFTYKITKDTLDVACDFIAGWILMMILLSPFVYIRYFM